CRSSKSRDPRNSNASSIACLRWPCGLSIELVRHAAIVAGRLHAVMRAQRLVAARLILPRVVIEIAEGGGQAVAAMLQRGAAERPQRILQPLGQCYQALTAEDDMGVLPSPRRPGGSDRAGDRVANRRC